MPNTVDTWLSARPWSPFRHCQWGVPEHMNKHGRDKDHMPCTPSAPWSCGTKTTHHLPQSLLVPGYSLLLSVPSSKALSSLTYQLSPRKSGFGAVRLFLLESFFLRKGKEHSGNLYAVAGHIFFFKKTDLNSLDVWASASEYLLETWNSKSSASTA